MLDLKLLQKEPEIADRTYIEPIEPETVAAALKARNSKISMDEFLEMDKRRRAALAEVESLKNRRNTESAEVARRKKAGEDASDLVAELGRLSDRIKALDAEAEAIKEEVHQWMLSVPNMPDASVPVGRDESENVEVHRWGEQPKFSFPVREHWELGAALGGLDFERAGKLAGSRFSVSRGAIARLERALYNFYLDTQTSEFGHTEIMPPFMVNRASMQGTGQLPKFEEDLFRIQGWDHYLIPTAEVPLTNLHAGEVLDEADLPIRACAGQRGRVEDSEAVERGLGAACPGAAVGDGHRRCHACVKNAICVVCTVDYVTQQHGVVTAGFIRAVTHFQHPAIVAGAIVPRRKRGCSCIRSFEHSAIRRAIVGGLQVQRRIETRLNIEVPRHGITALFHRTDVPAG